MNWMEASWPAGTYPLHHGLGPLRGAVLGSPLQHSPQDVDEDVTAEQTHHTGEGRAEGRRHGRSQGWVERNTQDDGSKGFL